MAHGTSVSDNRGSETWVRGRWSEVAGASAVIASGLALAVAIGFWIHYGTTVFFQMLAAGFAACF